MPASGCSKSRRTSRHAHRNDGHILESRRRVRTLLLSIALVAVHGQACSVFSTHYWRRRSSEAANSPSCAPSVRCAFKFLGLITTEALLLTGAGSIAGSCSRLTLGRGFENLVRQFLPLAPSAPLLLLTWTSLWQCAGIGGAVGCVSGPLSCVASDPTASGRSVESE